jgi:hypothetical protein
MDPAGMRAHLQRYLVEGDLDPALKDKTSFDKTTAALVEIEQRRAYEEKLEAALKVCADSEN